MSGERVETTGGTIESAPGPEGRAVVTSIGPHTIHALEYGRGERTILLLHGLSGSSRWWSRNVAGLARGFRVLVPDLIGFGKSRPVGGTIPTIEELSHLVLEWMHRVAGRGVNLIGHSLGGQLAVHIATDDPTRVDRLVLADPAGLPRPVSPGAVIRFAAEIAPVWRWGDPSFLPVIAADAWTAGPGVLIRTVRSMLRDDVRPLLPRITMPTLIIWGERDTLVPLRDAWVFRRMIPDSRLAILRGAAHNSMVDRPTDFNRLVLRFLDDEPVGR